MNDPTFPQEPSREPPSENEPLHSDVPQFGAIDIVEAFTAMRHEWRGQTKESRALTELIQTAVTNLQSLESKVLAGVREVRAADARAEDNIGQSAEARNLALLIVETDHQLSRAVVAISQWDENCGLREQAETRAAEEFFAAMNPVSRWFARPLLRFISGQRTVSDAMAKNPMIEGLNLVLARLRGRMKELQIERFDVEGQAFDADTMHAIGTIADAEYPSGHVAEQLSPAYSWRGRLLRFADVRVAK